MTGWNMPPGVNARDIPGNRSEDEIWEKEAEKFCSNCPQNERCRYTVGDCERSKEFERHFEALLEEGEEKEQEEYGG